MMRSRWIVVAVALCLCTTALGAQHRRLTYVPDTAFQLADQGIRRLVTALVRKDGRIVVASEYYYGEAIALDSMGRKLPWALPLGPQRGEVGTVGSWGWVGDSLWIADGFFKQIAIVGGDAKVAASIRFPSWVRPFWRDRRKYPLFSDMAWLAMYGDGTMLVEPSQSRTLLDTPGYDRSQKLLVRVDRDGRIVRTVARVPEMDGRMVLRSGAERRTVTVPGYARTFWKASTDGERVAVLTPSPKDSGAFQVTMLSSWGDTVFSKRYVVDAARAAKSAMDGFLASIKPFGRYTAEQIRDTVAKQISAFSSPVLALHVGLDHSTWVRVRRPASDPRQSEWFVIDEKGAPVGNAFFALTFRPTALSVDRIWTVERDRVQQTSTIVRLRRADATGVRPARSARTSASSTPARPRE